MNPESFLDTACYLLELNEPNQNNTAPDFESDHRSAASRSYYAAFLAARDLLETMGISLKKNSSVHQQVINHFSHSKVEDCKKLSKMLDDMRKERNAADYKLFKLYTHKRSHLLYLKSTQSISVIKKIKKDGIFFKEIKSKT